LVVYRADNVKATLFYRITDEEKWVEIESDLQKIKQMGIRIASVTSDGSEDIIKAVRIACPHAVRQRCLAHIERECLVWLTQHPRTSAGQKLHIYLDGARSYPYSFLDESFGKLAREFGLETVEDNIIFHATEKAWVIGYIHKEVWKDETK
jgi:hypothetical protein